MRSAGTELLMLTWTAGWQYGRGVGLITAEFYYVLAGDQDALNRHGEILRGANELIDLREELIRVTGMMMNYTAAPPTTAAGQPASSANVGQATEAAVPAVDAPMPLLAEAPTNTGAPATTAPAALLAIDMWLRRMGRATDCSAQW
eukprot:1118917-Pyramimonas_sp.AAC.1